MMKKIKLGLYVDEKTNEQIEELCKRTFLSKSGLVSMLVNKEINNQTEIKQIQSDITTNQ
jgi:PHP family Zn ribbon phosphoesterase